MTSSDRVGEPRLEGCRKDGAAKLAAATRPSPALLAAVFLGASAFSPEIAFGSQSIQGRGTVGCSLHVGWPHSCRAGQHRVRGRLVVERVLGCRDPSRLGAQLDVVLVLAPVTSWHPAPTPTVSPVAPFFLLFSNLPHPSSVPFEPTPCRPRRAAERPYRAPQCQEHFNPDAPLQPHSPLFLPPSPSLLFTALWAMEPTSWKCNFFP